MHGWLISAALILAAAPVRAEWGIQEWTGGYELLSDGTVKVQERLAVDFKGERKHGIRRWIPTAYRDPSGFNYDIRLEIMGIEDANGLDYPVLYGREGRNITARIGDPDAFANRHSVYDIRYKVSRGWLHQDGTAIFRWNITGNEWEIPIERVQVVFHLPNGLSPQDPGVAAKCHTGVFGSTAQDCIISNLTNAIELTAGPFRPGEGVTVEIDLPSSAIVQPTFLQRAKWFLKDNGILLLPLFVLALMCWLWHTRGRDEAGKRLSVMPQYHPPAGLAPAEMGALVDETVDMRDISSTILDLAVRGYIRIVEREEKGILFNSIEMRLKRLKPADAQLKPFEREMMEGLFARGDVVDMADLKNRFYTRLPKIKDHLYKSLVESRCFSIRPDRVRLYYWVGGGAALAGAVFILTTPWLHKVPWAVAVGLSGIIVAVFGRWMPRKTRHGADLAKEVLGFEEYVTRAEKDRIERATPEEFHQYLPHAMALGIEDAWADRFKGLSSQPPDWYHTAPGRSYTSAYLVSSWHGHRSALHTAMASTPRGQGGSGVSGGFSGGGFSGGGFGGGGGGGW